MRAHELVTGSQHATQRAMDAKRLEMELKFLRTQLDRCKRGIPASSGWIANWRGFIRQQVAAAGARARQQHCLCAQQQAGCSGVQQSCR